MRRFDYQVPTKGILLILFELGFGLKFDIVGSISISELFVFFYTVYFIIREPMFEEQSFKRLCFIYALLFGTQCVSEVVVGNVLSNSLKGISITVISFCHVYFLIRMFKSTRRMLPWAFLGMVLRPIFMETDYQGDALLALNGQDNVYLKFVIAPLIINVIMLYSYFRDKKSTSLIMIALGVVLMLLGARSWGALAFMTGVMTLFIIAGKMEKVRSLVILIVASLTIAYGAYVLYVDSVLEGRIATGNSGQINRTDDPYNPINLLKVGRTEAFIGAIAFSDAPLWGHGAWRKDSDYGYKYTKMKSQYQHLGEKSYLDDLDVIPCHSVLIGFGCYNGIFTFVVGCCLIGAFIIMGLLNVFISRRNIILSTYFLIIMMWHTLFSPQSHLRLTLPLYMAFIYVNFFYKRKQNVVENNELEMNVEAINSTVDDAGDNDESEGEQVKDKVIYKDYVAEYQKRHKPLI